MAFRRSRPTALRQNDRNGLASNQLRLIQGLSGFTLDNGGAALIAVGFSVFENLVLDQRFQPGSTFQRALKVDPLHVQFLLLALYLYFFELRQVAQTKIQYRFGLNI